MATRRVTLKRRIVSLSRGHVFGLATPGATPSRTARRLSPQKRCHRPE